MDNNNMALAVDTYEIVENLFTGESNVSDEVMTKAIESDPSAFVRAMIDFINGCEDDANSTHDKIEALQNRGFFKKMVSNNTRDIADILVQQNKVILGVLRLTQGTIYLCYSNVGLLDNMLTEIENQIQNAEPEESTELKRLMASGIKQATASARKAEDKILAVERINDKLEKKANAMIIDINALAVKNEVQDEKLTEHEKDINAIEGVNKNQDELLKSHDADIDKNEENIGINRESINSNKADIEKNSQKISSLIEEISALKLADDNARKEIAKARIIALAASGVSAAALLLSVLIAFGVI